MKDIQSIHREAIGKVKQANILLESGQAEGYLFMIEKAFLLEQKAAMRLLLKFDSEPTRSILFRSAANLAFICGKFKESNKLIHFALAGNPYNELLEELLELEKQVQLSLKQQNAFINLKKNKDSNEMYQIEDIDSASILEELENAINVLSIVAKELAVGIQGLSSGNQYMAEASDQVYSGMKELSSISGKTLKNVEKIATFIKNGLNDIKNPTNSINKSKNVNHQIALLTKKIDKIVNIYSEYIPNVEEITNALKQMNLVTRQGAEAIKLLCENFNDFLEHINCLSIMTKDLPSKINHPEISNSMKHYIDLIAEITELSKKINSMPSLINQFHLS